VPYT